MAAGEYVSVHSQADTEQCRSSQERKELAADDKGEHKELAGIYIARGLDPVLAKQVAQQLMAHDALGAHARDELGISTALSARPIQAAFASAGSFAVGAALPLVVTAMVSDASLIYAVTGSPCYSSHFSEDSRRAWAAQPLWPARLASRSGAHSPWP